MNIKRAKEEIEHTIRAYLAKDEHGDYRIPVVSQRPILLMGAPGIGKTAIMEQVARACNLALVSYTMTHHTRQSAIGLPYILKKKYGGKEYSVTEYTMSEIIASVYDKMEETGLHEGILFIDEINCVSETLAPTMLQFLQGKTFGSHRVPDGWIIVAAGNPPEYNKPVREFDVVTLDRLKRIDVQADFAAWKEYAYAQSVHGAILSYLEIKKEHFYQIQTTIDGKVFATARGWEDLSKLIQTYEALDIPVDQDVVYQYIQHRTIAKDFANYLELYAKYKQDYHIDAILDGQLDEALSLKLKMAPFDEKLSVIGLLLSKLNEQFREYDRVDRFVSQLYEVLKGLKTPLLCEENRQTPTPNILKQVLAERTKAFEQRKKAALLDKLEERCEQQVLQTLESYTKTVQAEHLGGHEEAFTLIKDLFELEVEHRQEVIEQTANQLEHAFDFMEAAFGESQEMVVFITELTVNFFSAKFLNEHECERYYRYNKGLLFGERQRGILKEIDEIQGAL